MSNPLPTAELDLIIPVYNEGLSIRRALEEIYRHVPLLVKRVLIVYDFDEDDTVPVIRQFDAMGQGIVLVKNTLGRGVLNAVRAGIAATTADVVIITMADLCDDVRIIPRMVELIRDEQYDIVCASRYMRGGQQIGGPRLKKLLSRIAGVSLYWLAGLPTHDATNAFAPTAAVCWQRRRSRAEVALRTRWKLRPRRLPRANGLPKFHPSGETAPRGNRNSSSGNGYRIIYTGTFMPCLTAHGAVDRAHLNEWD